MSRRQQRAPRNRRVITPNVPAAVPQLIAVIQGITFSTVIVKCVLAQLPPTGSETPLPLVIAGVPQWRRRDTGDYATGAVLQPDGETLYVTFPGPNLDTTDEYDIGPLDPAIRTSTGGYVAPALLASAELAPTGNGYVATAPGTPTVSLNLAPNSVPDLIVARTGWRHVPSGTRSEEIQLTTSLFLVTFGTNVSAGDTIVYDPQVILNAGPSVSEPTRAPVVCV